MSAQSSGKPTGEPWYSGWSAYAFAAAVIASGFACHAIFTVVNFRQGATFGYDEWSNVVGGSLSLAVDLIGVGVCTGIAGRLRASQSFWAARRMMVIVYLSAAYSLLMFYGYNAAQRVEPTKQAAAEAVAAHDAKEKSDIASAEERAKQIEWLRGQAAMFAARTLDKKLSDEQRLAAQMQADSFTAKANKASFDKVELEASPVARSRDAMATTFAARIGWSVGSVQEALGIVPPAILMLISIATIRYGFQSWPQSKAPSPAEARLPARREAGLAPDNDERTILPFLPRARQDSLRRETTVEDQIRQWVAVATRKAGGVRTKAAEAHEHYQMFARHMGYEPVTLMMWGSNMRKLNAAGHINWPKTETTANVRYLGRALDYTQPWALEIEHPAVSTPGVA